MVGLGALLRGAERLAVISFDKVVQMAEAVDDSR